MTKRYEDPLLPVKIDYTAAAEKIIAKLRVPYFLMSLVGFMDHVGADYAYVGAKGQQLSINLVWPPGSRVESRLRK